MFESAELGHAVDKKVYDREVPKLRTALLDAQLDALEQKKFATIVLIGGVDGAGKGETVNILNEWMDPRHIQTHAMGGAPTDEELSRPRMWRFWRALPPKGKMGIFFGSWYTDPILQKVRGGGKTAELDRALEEILRFERMLADEGALLVKFWFHLSKKKQKERLKDLEKNKATRWRVAKTDWENHKLYDKFRPIDERALRHTSTEYAPWIVVEGFDSRYRSLTTGKVLLDNLRRRIKAGEVHAHSHAPPAVAPTDEKNVLRTLDMSLKFPKKKYDDELERQQGRLNALSRDKHFRDLACTLVFEGSDAAGKGGAIRRITGALDARQYQVVPIAAPTEEERAQPYLWRFWRHVPRKGKFALFDRSWYGRVLVERVEGFCGTADWMRAYSEINDFEENLARHGIVMTKFWLTISKEEQLARFQAREKTGFKRFKITDDDWRNRDKWDAYERAVCDMVDRTSTDVAPWVLVEANDKRHARIKVMKTICARIEAAFDTR
jgi:polyphosphate:AMP phosphotransferase